MLSTGTLLMIALLLQQWRTGFFTGVMTITVLDIVIYLTIFTAGIYHSINTFLT